MRLAAFDLEIAKILPQEVKDLKEHAPLGISCAAVARSDGQEVDLWSGYPQMTEDECRSMVTRLQALVEDGYTLVSWNGASFDFFVLAQESGLVKECGDLALGHVDLMTIVTFSKGYYLGLDKALAGAGLSGKLKSVLLKDGSTLSGMSGAQAPIMWQAGEQDAVIEYLKGDVTQLLALAEKVKQTKTIRWNSNRGKPQSVRVKKLMAVSECFAIPQPDTSWMSNPPRRSGFVDWIPDWQSKVG